MLPVKFLLTCSAVAFFLIGCSSSDEPQPEPQPEPKPADTWLLAGYNSGDQPNTLLGYRERIVYHDNQTIRTITGDTLTTAPEDPEFSFRHEFIYEGGIFTKVVEFDVYERTYHVAFELQYDDQKRIASIDQYFSSVSKGREYTATRKFFYNTAGKVEKIEVWDKRVNGKHKELRYTWTGNNVTRQDITNYKDNIVVNTWHSTITYNDAADNVWKATAKEMLAADAYFENVPHENQIKTMVSSYPDKMVVTDNFTYTTDERGLMTQRKQDRTYAMEGAPMSSVTTYYNYSYRKAIP